MKVAGIGQVVKIKVFPAQFCNSTGVGEDVAPGVMLQDDRKTGFDFPG